MSFDDRFQGSSYQLVRAENYCEPDKVMMLRCSIPPATASTVILPVGTTVVDGVGVLPPPQATAASRIAAIPETANRHQKRFLREPPNGNTPAHTPSQSQVAGQNRRGTLFRAVAELTVTVRVDCMLPDCGDSEAGVNVHVVLTGRSAQDRDTGVVKPSA